MKYCGILSELVSITNAAKQFNKRFFLLCSTYIPERQLAALNTRTEDLREASRGCLLMSLVVVAPRSCSTTVHRFSGYLIWSFAEFIHLSCVGDAPHFMSSVIFKELLVNETLKTDFIEEKDDVSFDQLLQK